MIRNWNEFDNKLRDVALIDVSVKEAGRVRDLALIEAETAYKSATATRIAARAAIVKDLEKFYQAGGKRSIELMFGRAGIRSKAATLKLLKGIKWPQVIQAIKDNFVEWQRFIAVKESVKKDEVKRGMTPEMMAAVGVSAKAAEEFFIETFPEKLGEAERVA